MELLKEFVNQYAVTILYTILTGVATAVGIGIKKLYTKYINDKTKKSVVNTCVRAVEQMYADLHGAKKLEKCIDCVSEMLDEKGITISNLEIRMLIEASINAMNREIGDIFDGIDTAGASSESETICEPDNIG